MIIKVEQTHSNFKSKFEIKVNDELRYLAGTPWMEISTPLDIDKIRQCVLANLDNSICYITSYNAIENIAESAIPMKWVFTGEQKSFIFKITDEKNNICAKFYEVTNGFADRKYIIEYENEAFKVYDVSVGKTRNLLIFKDDVQIAEIVKPLSVSNNLDNYYVYLLDEYSKLEKIVSFFTIYFDYHNYSNSGQVVAHKKEVVVKYSYDKNTKFYDKNWLTNNFNKEDVGTINNQIMEDRKNTINYIKKYGKIVALILLALFIIFGLLYYFYLR